MRIEALTTQIPQQKTALAAATAGVLLERPGSQEVLLLVELLHIHDVQGQHQPNGQEAEVQNQLPAAAVAIVGAHVAAAAAAAGAVIAAHVHGREAP